MKDNFNQSDNKVTKLLKGIKEEFLLTKQEKSDLKYKVINKIAKLNTSVTKPNNKRYSIWSYQLNFKGVVMPLIPFILALVIAIGTGTVVTADNANPGDILFGLDQLMENIQEQLPMSQSSRAKFLSRLSEERTVELSDIREEIAEEVDGKARERWEQHQEEAIERLAVSIERVEAAKEKIQEALTLVEDDDQKKDLQKIINRLDEAQGRRETRISRIENREFPGLEKLPVRRLIKNWQDISPEKRAEIRKKIRKEFKGIIHDIKDILKDKDHDDKDYEDDKDGHDQDGDHDNTIDEDNDDSNSIDEIDDVDEIDDNDEDETDDDSDEEDDETDDEEDNADEDTDEDETA